MVSIKGYDEKTKTQLPSNLKRLIVPKGFTVTLKNHHFENVTPSVEPPSVTVTPAATTVTPSTADSDAKCNACGKGSGLKQCSKCKKVRYCDRTCQRKDFPSHKLVCESGE